MKKKIITVFVTLIIMLVTVEPINASSGKLKGASIVSCNGVNYGSHSADNHWHKAKEHDSGWYPDGGVVSATNPCASITAPQEAKPETKKETVVAPKKETAAEIEKRKELERINEEKKQAEIAKLEKEKAEKLELARIEKERQEEVIRLEKIKQEEILRIETIRLNNADVSNISLNNSDKITVSYKNLDDIGKVKVILGNPTASIEGIEVSTTDVFSYNDFIINVVSENGLVSKPTRKKFYLVGDNKDLLNQKLDFSYKQSDDKISLDYIDGIHSIKLKKSKDIINLPLELETINGENLPSLTKVNIVPVVGNDYSHIIELSMMDESFEVPLNVIIEKNTILPLLATFVSAGSLSAVTFYKKKKNK